MKGKSKAAVFLAAALITGAAAPGNPVRAAEEKDKMIRLAEAENPGKYIQDLTTNRSMYYPGETIQGTLSLSGVLTAGARVVLRLRHLDQTVWEDEAAVNPGAVTFSFTVLAPERDFTGYALEVYLYAD